MIDFVAALALSLSREAVPQSQLISGAPETGFAELGDFEGNPYGVWEMTVGAMSDVEEDELFIVLAGTGTVAFSTGEEVELMPGTVGRLEAGQHTVWTATSTLRKIYISATGLRND